MEQQARVLVLGGTGHFGGRICRRLLRGSDVRLIVTGRDAAAVTGFAQELNSLHRGRRVQGSVLDQHSPSFAADLRGLGPDIVVHTAGPFQGQDYRVAEACIALGSHYVDLADGREFVQGFGRLNDDARRNNVLAVSGASTLPGVSSAVVDLLRDRFDRIDEIEICIAPAHQTPRGRGTIGAVLSYCGQPFSVLDDGKWTKKFGWQDLRLQRHPNLGWRLSGACDVPDLSLLPEYAGGADSVTFHAALEAWWENLALWLMAGLTRVRVIDDWARFMPAFQWLSARLINFGSRTGGMHLRLSGRAASGNSAKVCRWFLTARQNHGPEIPCAPALVLVRKLAGNRLPQRGACACLGMVTMAELAEELADLDISWEVRE